MGYIFIQRLLKKRFPHLNPFRKNNRVIPKFRGKIISNVLHV